MYTPSMINQPKYAITPKNIISKNHSIFLIMLYRLVPICNLSFPSTAETILGEVYYNKNIKVKK